MNTRREFLRTVVLGLLAGPWLLRARTVAPVERIEDKIDRLTDKYRAAYGLPALPPHPDIYAHQPFYTQLAEAGRVIDLAGDKLSIDALFLQFYDLRRHREALGERCETIDLMTTVKLHGEFGTAIHSKYTKRYGVSSLHLIPERGTIAVNGVKLEEFLKFDVPDVGVSVASFPEAVIAGSVILLDWSDLYWHPPAAMSVDHPERHLLYQHVGGFVE